MSLHSRALKSTSDSFSVCFFPCTNLRFFTRIRRLLLLTQSKPPEKSMDAQKPAKNEEETAGVKSEGQVDWMAALQKSVKKLHFGSWEEKEAAAAEIQKLAAEDMKRRKTMAELGVIRPLVAMAGSEVLPRRTVAVRALVHLANGSFTNKALMVEAGLLSTLPEKMGVLNEAERQELAELLLSVSSLPNTEFPHISAAIIPAVISILHSDPNTPRTKQSCTTTLYNLSTLLDNAGPLVAAGAVTILLSLSSVKPLAGECLATLGNLVVKSGGRREMERSPMMPESLIQILAWEDHPNCQESAAYILMVLAHQSPLQRRKMAAAPALLEVLLGVALLGSPLAQKRALKMVEMFRDERRRGIAPHSGPQMAVAAAVNRRSGHRQGRRLMQSIVKQSLDKNMEIITRRANGCDWLETKEFVVCSSSKSLPY